MDTRNNFIYLTLALVTLLLGMAVSQQFFDESAQRLMQSSIVVTLFAVVWDADNNKHAKMKALFFPVIILLSALIGYWLDSANLVKIHLVFMLVFFSLTAYKTAVQVLFSGKVDGNKILGAICLYMLMGLIWAVSFTLMELIVNNSFNSMHVDDLWFKLLPEFVYFSFVTLTTLGYGDISPALPLSKFLVYFEALVGQFYMAILVASLVGAHMANRQEKANKNS